MLFECKVKQLLYAKCSSKYGWQCKQNWLLRVSGSAVAASEAKGCDILKTNYMKTVSISSAPLPRYDYNVCTHA